MVERILIDFKRGCQNRVSVERILIDFKRGCQNRVVKKLAFNTRPNPKH
jgi:hypothetical protein